MSDFSIVWMRRNLRLYDNKPLSIALKNSSKVLPVFIFDPDILSRFNNKNDRRLSFIASILFDLNNQLKKFNGNMLVLYGRPIDIMPRIAKLLDCKSIYADEDFEPSTIARDQEVKNAVKDFCDLDLIYDHLLIHPSRIVGAEGLSYKVYTHYMKEFYRSVNDHSLLEYSCDLNGKMFDFSHYKDKFDSSIKIVNIESSIGDVLEQIDYLYMEDSLWDPRNARNVLQNFVQDKITFYKKDRDSLNLEGTSAISPYLRFGVLSIRECYRLAFSKRLEDKTWINELIWREFYATILYHFPETTNQEFQVKYRGKIPWNKNSDIMEKFCSGQTGFPIVDACIRQLLNEGWMHNRGRMIVASFFTKNLFMDWRLGEEFFAQYLMDYDLSSNVGGWQWCSSCGNDAQPYFRIFNPFLQGQKFDFDASYTKKYVPELLDVDASLIHNKEKVESNFDGSVIYPKPILDYTSSRKRAIEIFKSVA